MAVQLTLGSRAVIIGGNGSGKSTVLKLLIGDLEPEEGVGATWKHHNLRLSYVAQQSLHHLALGRVRHRLGFGVVDRRAGHAAEVELEAKGYDMVQEVVAARG